jgi:hypothetical protein
MSFSPNLFLSNIAAKGGPAKPSRFEVVIPIPILVGKRVSASDASKLLDLSNTLSTVTEQFVNNLLNNSKSDDSITTNVEASRFLALQCESTELPGKAFTTTDVKIYGPTFKVPNQVAYSDISLTFICTNEFNERKLFDVWMESIMSPVTNNFRFPKAKGGGGNYLTQMKIIQYDDFVKQIYAVELMDAFPIGITAQPVSWGDDGVHKLTVQFSYHKYRTIYEGNYDEAKIVSALTGSAFANLTRDTQKGITNALGGITSKIPLLNGRLGL